MRMRNLLILPLIFSQFFSFAQQTRSSGNYSGNQVVNQSQVSGNNINSGRTPEARTSTPDNYASGSSTTYDVQSTKQVSNIDFTRSGLEQSRPTPVQDADIPLRSSMKPGPEPDPYSYPQKSGLLFSTNDYINRHCHSQVRYIYPGYYYDFNMKRHRLFGYGVQVGLYTDIETVKKDVIRYTYAFKLPVYFIVDVSEYPCKYRLIIGHYYSKTPALKLRNYLWKYFPGCFVIRYNTGYGPYLSSAYVVDRYAIPDDF
jgi:hypothetical protein